jgi:hypothetical protein
MLSWAFRANGATSNSGVRDPKDQVLAWRRAFHVKHEFGNWNLFHVKQFSQIKE